jgi:hypothetical protein
MDVIIVWIALLGAIWWMASRKSSMPSVFSHWHHRVENMQESTQGFYVSVEQAINSLNIPETKISRTSFLEGNFTSARRDYLRVARREHVFDICAAPFANGFFVSWWLGEETSLLVAFVTHMPWIGPWLSRIFRPMTYFRMDTATMFQECVNNAVQQVLDERTKAQGLRSLSDTERKPIMRDFFAKFK